MPTTMPSLPLPVLVLVLVPPRLSRANWVSPRDDDNHIWEEAGAAAVPAAAAAVAVAVAVVVATCLAAAAPDVVTATATAGVTSASDSPSDRLQPSLALVLSSSSNSAVPHTSVTTWPPAGESVTEVARPPLTPPARVDDGAAADAGVEGGVAR